jgi:hypothetical protein
MAEADEQQKGVDWGDLLKTLTVDQLVQLKEEVLDLEKALKLIPKAFDESFQEKINTILDITSEIEKHSINYQINVSEQVKKDIRDCINTEVGRLSKKHNNNYIIMSSLLSGAISAFIVIIFFSI